MVAPAVKQTWAVMGVLLSIFGQGMVLSFPSILLPAILNPESEIKTDLHIASWIASCIGISGIPGFFASSLLMDWYGRKITHIIFLVPGIIGWILIYIASNVSVLMLGRVLCGVASGATVILGAVVIGEYTSPKNRGMFLNLKTTAVSLGSMTVHISGSFLTWKLIALTALVPHIASLLIILTWPESPAWLVSKKRFELSEKSFYWLRGSSAESIKEFEELVRAQKEIINNSKQTSTFGCVSEFLNKFTRRDFLKPALIITVCSLLLEASGRHNFPAYALQIIGQVTGNTTHLFYYTLGIDVIISVSTLFSSILVKVLKRRPILFCTGFAAIISLFCLCLYLYLSDNGIISKDKSGVPIALFSIYFILTNLGCTPIPLALFGEIFPLAHRGAGSAVSGLIMSMFFIICVQVTPYLLVSVKVYGTFAVFGSVMGLSLVILYFILPETKDRTLQQIEDYFNFGRFREDSICNDDDVQMKMIVH